MPKDYVLIHHMARSPRCKTLRAARCGHRSQGVLLDDGTRIRMKGDRCTEVSFDTLVANHQMILEHVRVGTLEAVNPITERPVPYEELEKLVKHLVTERGGLLQNTGLQEGVIDGADAPENTAPSALPAEKDDDESNDEDEGADEDDSSAEDTGYTEEDLMKMNRSRLDEIAVEEFGIQDASKLPNKAEVVKAIFEAQE